MFLQKQCSRNDITGILNKILSIDSNALSEQQEKIEEHKYNDVFAESMRYLDWAWDDNWRSMGAEEEKSQI